MLDARPVEGRFRSARWWVTGALVAILFGIPWIRIGGEPLVLLDIAARRFHFGPLVIFPQELYFLWLLIIGLAIALFFFTSLAGRLWCGWACPQTVFTDVFALIARRVEGWQGYARPKRVATWRKVLLHVIWLMLCAGIAFHLVGYFRSPYVMVDEIVAGAPSRTTVILWTVVTLLAYVDFALVRQTFCKYLCPYARFQGVMFDRDTLVVGYDTARGEPRGKRAGAGDCVDCGLCVQVCPTGIDIRKGLQLECIACTQCIDACDGVMAKVGREPSLIGYRSLVSLEEGRRTRLLRPRVLAYGVLLCVVIGAFATLLVSRKLIDMQVVHNRTELYHQTADGRTSNSYILYIQNRESRERTFRVRVDAGGTDEDFELVAGMNPVRVPASDDLEARVFVLASPEAVIGPRGRDLDFVIESVDGKGARVVRKARFLAPRSS